MTKKIIATIDGVEHREMTYEILSVRSGKDGNPVDMIVRDNEPYRYEGRTGIMRTYILKFPEEAEGDYHLPEEAVLHEYTRWLHTSHYEVNALPGFSLIEEFLQSDSLRMFKVSHKQLSEGKSGELKKQRK